MRSALVTRMVVCATVLASALGLSTAPAGATGPGEVAYPLTNVLSGVTAQARMVYAAGHLFVSNGHQASSVLVYSTTGQLVHTITGEPGATGMALSSDGGTLYVANANSNTISAIDTSTYTHTEITVGSCPTYLAMVNGRLFYSYGCNGGSFNSSVASIDPASPDTPVIVVTGQYSPPLLAGAGTTLATSTLGLSPATLKTYTASSTGTLTNLASFSDINGVGDLAMSSSGSTLYVAEPAGGQFTALSTSSLAQLDAYPGTAYPDAVALSPDGSHVAGGLNAYGALVNLYDTSTTATLWQRYGATADPSTWATNAADDKVLPGSLTFSSDGQSVFALVQPENSSGVALFDSSISATSSTVSLSLVHVGSGKITATAKAPVAGKMFFSFTNGNGTTKLGTVTTSSTGAAQVTFHSAYDGTVMAVFVGAPTRWPAQVKRAFTMPSKSRVTVSGAYAKRHGVKLFHSRKDVRLLGHVSPSVAGRVVKATLEVYSHGRWHVVSTIKPTLDAAGNVPLILRRASKHVVDRVLLHFAGDRFNTGSHAKSTRFKIT